MAGSDRRQHLVNVGLYSTPVDETTSAQGDLWYNSTEGRVKTQVAGAPVGVGPHGVHSLSVDAANAWYQLQSQGSNTSPASVAQNMAVATPVYTGRKCTLTGLAVQVTAGTVAGAPLLMGLYGSDATTGMPGALIADYGNVASPTGAAIVSGWTVNTPLLPIPYWIVFVKQSATTVNFDRARGLSTLIPKTAGTPTIPLGEVINAFSNTVGFSGALPATFGAVNGTQLGPTIYFKIAL